jgi:hypothetical protein
MPCASPALELEGQPVASREGNNDAVQMPMTQPAAAKSPGSDGLEQSRNLPTYQKGRLRVLGIGRLTT